MNWANRLTIARFFLTLLFVLTLSADWRYGATIGLLVFIVASITDYADGQIARRFNMVTNFGKLMDPLVDKIMMASAFICLVPMKAIPAWVAIVIISREFLITGLRLLALSKGSLLPAEALGKHKTVWQIVTILFFLLLLAIREWIQAPNLEVWWGYCWNFGGKSLVSAALVFTLWSGAGYLWRSRQLIRTD